MFLILETSIFKRWHPSNGPGDVLPWVSEPPSTQQPLHWHRSSVHGRGFGMEPWSFCLWALYILYSTLPIPNLKEVASSQKRGPAQSGGPSLICSREMKICLWHTWGSEACMFIFKLKVAACGHLLWLSFRPPKLIPQNWSCFCCIRLSGRLGLILQSEQR